MTHVMIDLETMGKGPDAAIIAIGAVSFNSDTVLDKFYVNVDLNSARNYKLSIDPETVLWWMRQSDSARSIFTEDAFPLYQSLAQFTKFAVEVNMEYLWANGAGFDNVILANAYQAASLRAPWQYYNDRCYRTIKSMYPEIKLSRSGIHHNALDDAISQANHLIEICKKTGIKLH